MMQDAKCVPACIQGVTATDGEIPQARQVKAWVPTTA